MNKNRRRMLVSGKCDECPHDAVLPWKGKKYCYDCWNELMAKEADDAKRRKKKQRG